MPVTLTKCKYQRVKLSSVLWDLKIKVSQCILLIERYYTVYRFNK